MWSASELSEIPQCSLCGPVLPRSLAPEQLRWGCHRSLLNKTNYGRISVQWHSNPLGFLRSIFRSSNSRLIEHVSLIFKAYNCHGTNATACLSDVISSVRYGRNIVSLNVWSGDFVYWRQGTRQPPGYRLSRKFSSDARPSIQNSISYCTEHL